MIRALELSSFAMDRTSQLPLCFFIVLFLMPSSTDGREGANTSVIHYDEESRARGTITCPGNTLLDIVSIGYFHNSDVCNLDCPKFPRSEYLDATKTLCSNENNIRSACYAKNTCSLGDEVRVNRPDVPCYGDTYVTNISITYTCMKPDYVFDVCEYRALTVQTETPLIFTSPSQSTADSKRQCSCSLKSSGGGILDSRLTFTQLRMAQFQDDDELLYKYDGTELSRNSLIKNNQYLLPENVFVPGMYSPSEVEIIMKSARSHLFGRSKAFIIVEPGEGNTVECNDAQVATTASPDSTSMSTTSSSKQTSTPTTSSSKQTSMPTTSSTEYASTERRPGNVIRNSTSVNTSRGQGPSTTVAADIVVDSSSDNTDSDNDGVVIGLSIAIVLMIILAATGLLIYFLRRRRRKRAQKHVESMSNNNDKELSPLCPGAVPSITENTYHEIEREEETYDVIPGEALYSELPNEHGNGTLDTIDPYKVTLLDGGAHANFERHLPAVNEYATPADQLRNSHGSMDNYTVNSTITDDHYSQPMDVTTTGADGNKAAVEYDVPAEVTYAAIKKNPSVELIDNELYGT